MRCAHLLFLGSVLLGVFPGCAQDLSLAGKACDDEHPCPSGLGCVAADMPGQYECQPADCDVTLPATWSNDVDDTGDKGAWTAHSAGPQSVVLRVGLRFDIADLPAGKGVGTAELSFDVSYVSSGLATKTWSIGPYRGDGRGDPEADSGSAMYAGCDVATDNYVAATTDLRTTGVKRFSLTGQVLSDLEAARAQGTRFSIAVKMDDETGPDTFAGIDRYDQGPSMLLHVTCVAPGG